MSEAQFLLFIVTSLVIILVPGQDLVLVMSRGMTRGAKAGVITATGVSVGLLGHTLLAGLGLGAVLTASTTLFVILKYVGAAYLCYLGIRLLLSRHTSLESPDESVASSTMYFRQGALSNLSNPKISIFYFAYLPQFVSPEIANPTVYLLGLGASFAALTFLVKAPIGYFAGLASEWIKTRPLVITAINRVSGTMLIGLGAKLALEQR